MNILHLKYAVEIAKTGSLNKAAENLYMGQPNLSRAIRELEAGLGITIFERTPRGWSSRRTARRFYSTRCAFLRRSTRWSRFSAMVKSGD